MQSYVLYKRKRHQTNVACSHGILVPVKLNHKPSEAQTQEERSGRCHFFKCPHTITVPRKYPYFPRKQILLLPRFPCFHSAIRFYCWCSNILTRMGHFRDKNKDLRTFSAPSQWASLTFCVPTVEYKGLFH